MGYLSTIHMILTKSDADYLKNGLIEKFRQTYPQYPSCNPFFSYAPDYERELKGDYIYLCWKDLKFYDGYEDVDMFREWIRNTDHTFIRVGEEDGDVEYDDDMRVGSPCMCPCTGVRIYDGPNSYIYI